MKHAIGTIITFKLFDMGRYVDGTAKIIGHEIDKTYLAEVVSHNDPETWQIGEEIYLNNSDIKN